MLVFAALQTPSTSFLGSSLEKELDNMRAKVLFLLMVGKEIASAERVQAN